MRRDVDLKLLQIGRTARIGNQGLATTFYNQFNEDIAPDLVKILIETDQEVPDFLDAFRPNGDLLFESDDDSDDDDDDDDDNDGGNFGSKGGKPKKAATDWEVVGEELVKETNEDTLGWEVAEEKPPEELDEDTLEWEITEEQPLEELDEHTIFWEVAEEQPLEKSDGDTRSDHDNSHFSDAADRGQECVDGLVF